MPTQMNSTRKRKRIPGCKCQKSGCLRHYCECFNGKMYCSDACGCQHCLNRPEYQERISDLTEEIETQYTHAFVPNVVQPADQPSVLGARIATLHCSLWPMKQDSHGQTLQGENNRQCLIASPRHGAGCNCRKSNCVKNYCECFKAKMGCSRLCHCEGCNNPFDRNSTGSFMESKKREEDSYGGKPCNEDSLQALTADSYRYLFLPSHHSGISLPCASSDPAGSRRVAEAANPSPALGSFGQLASADALPAGSFPHSLFVFPQQNIVPPRDQSPIDYTSSDVTEHSAR